MNIPDRCRIHAAKADNVGMYTTANVLTHAANEIESLNKQIGRLQKAIEDYCQPKEIKPPQAA